MKIFGAILGGAILAATYYGWGIVWKSALVLAAGGTIMLQAGHAKDWREIFTTAGSICLFGALVFTLIILLQMFMA